MRPTAWMALSRNGLAFFRRSHPDRAVGLIDKLEDGVVVADLENRTRAPQNNAFQRDSGLWIGTPRRCKGFEG